MHRVLCSTGALIGRSNNRDITLLERYLDQIDCDGFEFMMYETWYDHQDNIKRYLNKLPAAFPVFHVEKSVGDRISRNQDGDTETAISLFECNCIMARDIGAEKLVLHLWGGLDSDKNIDHNTACYQTLRQISDSFGVALTVENVVCNKQDPMMHMKNMAHCYPDIQFTFDTKMAAFHNQLEAMYLPENRWLFQRITHMHINDYNGGYKDWPNLKTLHIGKGWVDFDRLFGWLHDSDYRGDFTLEATSFDKTGEIQLQELNASLLKIRNYLC